MPLKFLGRYAHEAVVVDPRDRDIYLTEDACGPNGLYYRWIPPTGLPARQRRAAHARPADAGDPRAASRRSSATRDGLFVDDLSAATETGTVYSVEWVDVPDRDAQTVSVRKQFTDDQVTRARKLEGLWWGDGGVYFVSCFARAATAASTSTTARSGSTTRSAARSR